MMHRMKGNKQMNFLAEVCGKEVTLDFSVTLLRRPEEIPHNIAGEISTELAKKHNIMVDWGVKESHKAKLYRLEISKGSLKKTFVKELDIWIMNRRMSSEAYDIEMQKLLQDMPEPARDFIHSQAWESHSYGYEECYNKAVSLKEDVSVMLEKIKKMS